MNGSIPQLIRFERYLLVAYSLAMLAHPPSTFWHDAACSLAEPSPGLTANIVLPTPTLDLCTSYVSLILCIMSLSSGKASPMHCPASLAFSAFCTSLARPTYAGSFLESANSARPRGLDLNDDVSPDGISSSVVVTGSCISDTTLIIRFSGSATISGQSLILGPNWISCSGSATPLLSNTLLA